MGQLHAASFNFLGIIPKVAGDFSPSLVEGLKQHMKRLRGKKRTLDETTSFHDSPPDPLGGLPHNLLLSAFAGLAKGRNAR